jgi:peptidoglycan/xylan/chitin deacetylase (PgdA/CDA1 family)
MRRTWAFITLVTFFALLAAFITVWQFSKSRNTQLFTAPISRVGTDKKVVALTFDDGPDPKYVDEVLQVLSRYSAKATFFLVGKDLALNEDAGRKIISAGHEIGNHSWSHSQLILKSLKTFTHEIEATEQSIRKTGQTGPIFFRPPYGKKLVFLPYYLLKTNRTAVLWDIEPDSLPSRANNFEAIVTDTMKRVRPGSIILMHVLTESRAPSRVALPRILLWLQGEGYQILTVGELLSLRTGVRQQ